MTKLSYRIARTLMGISTITAFSLIVTTAIIVSNTSLVNAKQNAAVAGTVNFTVAKNKLTVNLDLQNIPKGQHRADIHQGSCPLNFSLNGDNSPADGPFTPGVTLPLGLVQAKADGTLNKKLTFQIGGKTKIPANFASSGKWFFCIHSGTLAAVKGNNPKQLAASLGAFLKTKNGAKQVKQLACQAINGDSITINGAQGG